jgi:holin-like protein
MSGFAVLLAFQLIGEVVSYLLGGLVPGPVIGMALIFVALVATSKRPAFENVTRSTVETSRLFLGNLGLLFVPAGVGIVKHLDLIAERGAALLAVIAASTAVTLMVTVWCFLLVKRSMKGRNG